MMKYEDEMTPGEYRRYRQFNNGRHGHYCEKCKDIWECPQITHCSKPGKSGCFLHRCATCNGLGEVKDPKGGYMICPQCWSQNNDETF